MAKIMDYSWPGNIRELKNCLERAVILSDDGLIRPDHLMIANINRAHDNKGMIDISIHEDDFSLDQLVDKAMEKALALCDGNKSRAAELLKVDRKIFYRRNQKQPAAI
jgi:DNA-binding NtrC family response regulator